MFWLVLGISILFILYVIYSLATIKNQLKQISKHLNVNDDDIKRVSKEEIEKEIEVDSWNGTRKELLKMDKEKAVQIPLEVWQDPQGDVILNISERECDAYFGCWNEDTTPADYIAKISFIGCKSSMFTHAEFLDYDYEHLYHSYILKVLNSKWLEAQINKDNKLYPHNRKSINDYNHYVIKGHDVFVEVIAKDFKIEKVKKENAGEYARLSDEA